MDRRDPPPTEEGWYALHDFRRIDWDAWREAPDRKRRLALSEIIDHLEGTLAVTDADEGDSALYSVLGHEADIMLIHLRPSSAHLGALERQFEQTAFAGFTERTDSFVSVTEASGYSERARDYFDDELDESSGLANYIETRLHPNIPEATHVCFYPMNKRRDGESNWYDLSFEERAEHMQAHGDIGRDYGGKVVQMITGAIALDDWEWGVTLWGEDLTDMKDLLYEMRFDPSTSKFAEFGPFAIGRRFPPSDLPAFLAGEPVPTGEEGVALERPVHPAAVAGGAGEADSGGPAETGTVDTEQTASPDADQTETADAEATDGQAAQDAGAPATAEAGHTTDQSSVDESALPDRETPDDVETVEEDDLETRLRTLGLQVGEDYPGGTRGLVVYSGANAAELAEEVDGLRGNFEHYDTHVTTTVRASGGESAVVSIWETERAAGIAEGFLTDLSGVTRSISGALGEADARTTGQDSEPEAPAGDTEGGHADDHDEGHPVDEENGGPDTIREELADLDIYAGKPHGEDIYALVLYSTADMDTLEERVTDLAEGFDRYDTHEGTAIYNNPNGNEAAVVSLWATEDATETASQYLSNLPEITRWADEGEGFATMGMFYTVKPDYREEFHETFDEVGQLLLGMDGHKETALLVNTGDENDMFIASRWDSKDAAMEFFRSDAFTDTVDWGREVLADRPRHVFLA